MLLPGGSKLLAANEKADTTCTMLVLCFWMVDWASRWAYVPAQKEPVCIQGQLHDAGHCRCHVLVCKSVLREFEGAQKAVSGCKNSFSLSRPACRQMSAT